MNNIFCQPVTTKLTILTGLLLFDYYLSAKAVLAQALIIWL
jgi:hypothetical protein